MSGHSKWHNIQQKKGKTDAQRGKIFTKIGRELAVAVKEGGADIDSNSKLRLAVQKAKDNNMPNDNIAKAIKKASGELGSVNYEAITYEGYGVNGSAVIVECLTDNKNRTAGDIRHVFDKHNGSLGSNGCVSYLFKRKGIIVVELTSQTNNDTLFMQALEAGAEDIIEEENCFIIYTLPEDLQKVAEKLKEQNLTLLSQEIEQIPSTYVELNEHQQSIFDKMIEALDDLDDVQEIFHNVK